MDNYFYSISRKPDRQIYLVYDGIDVNDPELFDVNLYPVNTTKKHWATSVINNIKFLMPDEPPLLKWDTMNKV